MVTADQGRAGRSWQRLRAEQRSLFSDLRAQWERSWVFMAYVIGALALTWAVGLLPSSGQLLCGVLLLAAMWRLGRRSLQRCEARLEVEGGR